MSVIWMWLAIVGSGLTQQPYGTTRVAVVDVPAVSERYMGRADLETKLDQERVQFNKRRESIRDQMNRLAQSLQEQFKPGTDEFNQRSKQLTLLDAELKWFTESEGLRIEQVLAESLQQIFLDIQEAVREIAEEKNIDVVLAADRIPPDKPHNTSQARQQIVLQKVVYWNPRVDITQPVITRLNERYRARMMTTPAAPPTRNSP